MLRQLAASPLTRRLCAAAIDQSFSLGVRSGASQLITSVTAPISLAAATATAATHHPLSLVPVRCFAADAVLADDDDAPLPPLPLAEHATQGQYRDIEVPLYNINREPIGNFILEGDVFDVPIRRDILHRVVRWQLARRQQGTHKTKTRSEVRGGGRKPWNQKGSGRARAGTIRAPQWRGGGVSHGPVPRSHAHDLQKRVRRLGLKCALSAKAWERRLIVVDSLRPGDHKTKTMDGHMATLLEGAPRRSALLVDSDKEGVDGGEYLRLGIANLPWVDVIPSIGLNVYSMLQRDHVVITAAAVEAVVGRLRRPIKPVCSFTP